MANYIFKKCFQDKFSSESQINMRNFILEGDLFG